MLDAKLVQIPLGAHFNLSLHDCLNTSDGIEYLARVPYSSVVCFAIVCTLPDLAHAMSVLSISMSIPSKT